MDSSTPLENQLASNIPKLKEILKEKYSIDVPSQCEKFLERCLRQKDGNIEKAANLAQALHHVICDFKNWNVTLDPSCYGNTCYNIPVLCSMARRDKLGRRVLVGQVKLWDPDKLSCEEIAFAIWMLAQRVAVDEEDQKCGHVVIWDMEGFSLRQAWAIDHKKLLKFSKWVQNGVMGKTKGVHSINHPRIVQWIYEGLKPFLSEKMKKRVIFHKNLKDLQKSIELEPKLLPKFLGGDLEVKEYMDEEFMKNLLSSTEFFQDMQNYRFPVK